jgi:hypothetical protein
VGHKSNGVAGNAIYSSCVQKHDRSGVARFDSMARAINDGFGKALFRKKMASGNFSISAVQHDFGFFKDITANQLHEQHEGAEKN